MGGGHFPEFLIFSWWRPAKRWCGWRGMENNSIVRKKEGVERVAATVVVFIVFVVVVVVVVKSECETMTRRTLWGGGWKGVKLEKGIFKYEPPEGADLYVLTRSWCLRYTTLLYSVFVLRPSYPCINLHFEHFLALSFSLWNTHTKTWFPRAEHTDANTFCNRISIPWKRRARRKDVSDFVSVLSNILQLPPYLHFSRHLWRILVNLLCRLV